MLEPIDYLVAKEERDLFSGAVKKLPETERLIFRMVHLEGVSEKDTARCLSQPAAKVRRALARARDMLKARLA